MTAAVLRVRMVERFGFQVLDADVEFLRAVRIHDEFVAVTSKRPGA